MAARDPLTRRISFVLLISPAGKAIGLEVEASIPPTYVRVLFLVDAGDFESIKAFRPGIKEEEVGPGVLHVAGVDPLVLAVVNPEAVENAGHAGRPDRAHR